MKQSDSSSAPNDAEAADNLKEVVPRVERILAHAPASELLLEYLVELDTQPAVAVAIYEAVAPRIKIANYWIYYRVSRAYFLVGRDDACFAAAVAAIQMEPDYQHWHMFENIYRFFYSRGRYREALEIARHQIAHTPEIPIVSPFQLVHVATLANMPAEDIVGIAGDRICHNLHAESRFCLTSQRRYGPEKSATKCFALDQCMHESTRPSVTIWELQAPEVIVFDRNVLIFDSGRILQPDISVCEFPEALARKTVAPVVFDSLPVHDVATAVVISDKYGTANVCHFLLDQVSRLALYEPFCSINEVVVIGPSLVTDYQRRIVERLGVRAYQGTTDRCVIRAKRILVSETCKKTFVHPAHRAADWAISFLKRLFDFAPLESKLSRRIYISRRDAAARFVRNEEAVLARLRECGFEAIVLSDFDYDEQAALFAHSTHVVGMHGAGLTNIVFCPPGARVLEICHPVSGTAAYAVIASSLAVEYAAMVGRDADSHEPSHNDASSAALELGMGGVNVLANRDVVVDLAELDRWLYDSGTSS